MLTTRIESQKLVLCIPLAYLPKSTRCMRTASGLIAACRSSRTTRSLLSCMQSSPRSPSRILSRGVMASPQPQKNRFPPFATEIGWFAFPVLPFTTPCSPSSIFANSRTDPLLMNALNNVNQAAACLLTSTTRARELGIPESRWIYLLGGAGTQDADNGRP